MDVQDRYTAEYDEYIGTSVPGIPRKHLIENAINSEIERLIDGVNTTVVDKWYLNRLDITEDVPLHIINKLTTVEQYLNTMENHIAVMLKDAREIIKIKHELVSSKMVKRNNSINNRIKIARRYEEEEMWVLKRMQLLPDDLIRYISEFAFTPTIRIVFIKSYLNVPQTLNRIKNKNLTKMINPVKDLAHNLCRIFWKANDNKILRKYKPSEDDDVLDSICYVQHFHINKTATKQLKIVLYGKLFVAFEDIIKYYMQFTTKTFLKMQNLLIKLYKTITYVASHNCNRRG